MSAARSEALTARIEELKREIRAAFRKTRYPGDRNLCYDKERLKVDSELQEFVADFRGRDLWASVPMAVLRRNDQCIYFFSPEAYRFYLPAYMTAALDLFDADSMLYPLTIGSLTRTDRQYHLSTFEGFTVEQRNVIRNFLLFCRDEIPSDYLRKDVGKALEAYWLRGDE